MQQHARQATSSTRLRLHHVHMLLLFVAAVILFECSYGNVAFWRSLTGSTDSIAVHNTLGSGLQRLTTGGILVTDPANAYLEVHSDGTSPFILLQPSRIPPHTRTQHSITHIVYARIDAHATAGTTVSANTHHGWKALLETPPIAHNQPSQLRIWLQHPKGTILDLEDAKANVRVPFTWSWLRIGIISILAALVVAIRPRSRLWRIAFDTTNKRHVITLIVACLPLLIATMTMIIWQLYYSTPLRFYQPGNYTYDFDQYAHTAEALLHGQAHLDLPVPQALQHLPNPYDPAQRDTLLAHGVPNIYWDYAYYQGHWYSYFGVLPAIALFVPYKLVTQLMVPGGANLPTAVATLFCLAGFLVAGCFLVIKLLEYSAKRFSCATLIIAIIAFFSTTNVAYLWFRTTFYSLPVAASLLVTTLGLLYWLSKPIQVANATGVGTKSQRHRLFWGAFFISLNLGCRPTFVAALLLVAPLCYPYIRQHIMSKQARNLSYFTICLILPFLIVLIPVAYYNALRFGSMFNFGNQYQITVTDMTRMRLPAGNIIPTILAYLVLPLRIINTFPWIAIRPVNFHQWQYVEPMIGGIFSIAPIAILACISFMPRRNHCPRLTPIRRLSLTSLALAVPILLFNAYNAGLGWRYMIDFAWFLAIATVLNLGTLSVRYDFLQPHSSLSHQSTCILVRTILDVLAISCLIIIFLSWFVTAREDSILRFNPDLWYTVRDWLTL